MAGEKEVIIEFSKMLLDHSESLLTVAGGLAVVNLLLIANIHKIQPAPTGTRCLAFLVATSAFSSGVSFIFGYLANSAVIASMSDYATTGKWAAGSWAELFTLGQILALGVGVAVFLFVVLVYRKVTLDALTHVGLGGGGA